MESIKKILRTPSAFVVFLAAIVSLIGIIIRSEYDKAIARIPIDATSTAEARLTEIANFSNMTLVAISLSTTSIPAPTNTESPTSTFTAPASSPTASPVVDSQVQTLADEWQLNPVLPQPNGFVGWKSLLTSESLEAPLWLLDVSFTVKENELILVFGASAKLSPIGEIGTTHKCFLIASRGPITFSVDLLSALMEIHEVDETATSLAWAAQKYVVLQNTYKSTCGEGIDVAIGK